MKNRNESGGDYYENQNEIAKGIIWKTTMKLSDKKMKAEWNRNEIDNEISGYLYEMNLEILLQVMSEVQHLNEWET
jgi:hypothetical protein